MKEARRWLQSCEEAYNYLLHVCGDRYYNHEEANNNKNYIKTLFPIFKDMTIFSEFQCQDTDTKKLLLHIDFPDQYYMKVQEWFDNSIYQEFTLTRCADSNISSLTIPINTIIQDLLNNEITELQQECEEMAQPFYENQENQLLSDYEEKCLKEDEYYLGVRFVKYDGEYPNYCRGNVYLEIEGIPYEFYLPDAMGDLSFRLNKIKPEFFPQNIQRYYNEIMRVLRKNLNCTCCGGCS